MAGRLINSIQNMVKRARRDTNEQEPEKDASSAEEQLSEDDAASQDSSSSVETVYKCRRCPGMIIKSAERVAHKAFHSKKRVTRMEVKLTEEIAKKPGPASKTRKRAAEKEESLFEVIHGHKSKGSKKIPGYIENGVGVASEQEDEEDVSSAARSHRAMRKYIANTPLFNKKFPGA